MDDWKLPWEGGCRCGEVRFRVTSPPFLSGAGFGINGEPVAI